MYLEGIIICVNYADFLAHTLPHNRNQFNSLIVVTDTKDTRTKDVCDYYHVRCIQTDVFYENGDNFNKGKAINEGLKHLSKQGWVLHLDADIYLPPLTKYILDNLEGELEQNKIYGADRLMCPSYKEWIQFLDMPRHIQESYVFIHLDAFPIGVRVCEYNNKNAGYEPIGYFQLWHPNASGVDNYPTQHDYCDRTDVLHIKKFPRHRRELLPEIIVIHLDSDKNAMGTNWQGRKTPAFGKEDVKIERKMNFRRWLGKIKNIFKRKNQNVVEMPDTPLYIDEV
jgi:glycosyltransferase involved in cell wall biosynthesis